MKKLTGIIMILISVAANIFAQENPKTAATEKDEAAIRANVEQMVKGWNAKSGAEFARPFAEDADYVIINGHQIKSRAAIDAGHQQIFDTIYKNSTLSCAVEQIRFLRAEVAVVHIRAALTVTRENSAQKANAKITMVMTKNKDKWEIAAFQNTPIQDGQIREGK